MHSIGKRSGTSGKTAVARTKLDPSSRAPVGRFKPLSKRLYAYTVPFEVLREREREREKKKNVYNYIFKVCE
jgi:hypothetical protein